MAGDDTVLATVEPGKELDRDDALALANTLDHPRKMYGREVKVPIRRYDAEAGKRVKVGEKDGHVWHCSLSLKADADEPLTDEAWKLIAEQFVDRMGFIDPDGAKSSRWVAVRHGLSKNGNDHIHLAVQMVTEDGSRAREHNDQSRAQKICRQLEREWGLAITEGAALKQTLPHEMGTRTQRAGARSALRAEGTTAAPASGSGRSHERSGVRPARLLVRRHHSTPLRAGQH
ncbi:relaxase-like protein [Brevibacterium pityocampae]